MSYDNHHKQCREQKERLGLEHYQVTHSGCLYTATTAIAMGASIDSVHALGNWSIAGSWSLYNHSLPIDAIVAAAGFHGQNINGYFIKNTMGFGYKQSNNTKNFRLNKI
ncbi:hypothetical protein BJ165DRAFT_1400583 [Panaeolus papilionaceus]|nr:hypothetical protein BJ165DRAFT_1400583 [Panaeolus papilionaceus]